MPQSNYPRTVAEVLDDSMTFKLGVLRAMRVFKRARPWRGTIERRKERFCRLNRDLAAVCHIPEPGLTFAGLHGGDSGGSYYDPTTHDIVLTGRLSVVTYLHEFAHACGKGERVACRWSINLFLRIFPKKFPRLLAVGHMLRLGREC